MHKRRPFFDDPFQKPAQKAKPEKKAVPPERKRQAGEKVRRTMDKHTGSSQTDKKEAIVQAALAYGPHGADCLHPHDINRELQLFFRQIILEYLNREFAHMEWEIEISRNFFTLVHSADGHRVKWLQMRFAPSRCCWLLMRRGGFKAAKELNGNLWYPHTPDRSCMSLSDWMGQIRKIITGRL